MKYYSEKDIKGLLEQVDTFLFKELDNMLAIEIPDKHGDLKDADALMENIKSNHCSKCVNYDGLKCRACWLDDAMYLIEYAPTVLEGTDEDNT